MAGRAPGEAPLLLGGTAIKPEERHGWEAVKFFFWDPKRRAIMGRTPKSWGLISLFYLIYYLALAAFWAIMFFIFLSFINDQEPMYTREEGLIGRSPGVGFNPKQPDERDSSMVIFNMDNKLESNDILGWKPWADAIHKFLTQDYGHKQLKDCSSYKPHKDGSPCRFRKSKLGVCGQRGATEYGYKSGTPCVYLRLNKIIGLVSDYYNDTNDLPQDDEDETKNMPDELVDHLKSLSRRRGVNMNQVWLHCQGENPADKDAMGELEYIPSDRGFSSEYFPYRGVNEEMPYEPPVVAVRFKNATRGQLLHVECRAWAKNIDYQRMHRLGLAHFELMILDTDKVEVWGEEEGTYQGGQGDTGSRR